MQSRLTYQGRGILIEQPKNVHGTTSLLQFYQMRESQFSFLSCSRQSIDCSITCILQVFTSTKCLLYWMQCSYEMHLATGKNSINPAKLPNVPLQLTPVDGPACFCKPHCGIRTFIIAMISFLWRYIYCIPGVLQVHDISIPSLATIPCKLFLFCAGETNTPPINCFTADWGTGSLSLDSKPACFLWPRSYNFQHNNLKFNTISYGIK